MKSKYKIYMDFRNDIDKKSGIPDFAYRTFTSRTFVDKFYYDNELVVHVAFLYPDDEFEKWYKVYYLKPLSKGNRDYFQRAFDRSKIRRYTKD